MATSSRPPFGRGARTRLRAITQIGSCRGRGYSHQFVGFGGKLVKSAVFGTITATTLSIAGALAGCFAASQIVLRPMLAADNAAIARNNCYPWNASAKPRVTTAPLGYRREPGSFSAEN